MLLKRVDISISVGVQNLIKGLIIKRVELNIKGGIVKNLTSPYISICNIIL